MPNQSLKTRLMESLPNFPEEVIDIWILPLASEIGHFDDQHERWPNILGRKTLEYWRNTTWQKTRIALTDMTLTEETDASIREMFEGLILNYDNIYLRQLGNPSQKKVLSLTKSILETGNIPVPIIYEEAGPGRFILIDGNHRYISYIWAWRIWESVENLPLQEQVSKAREMRIERIVQPIAEQEIWICSLQQR